jgi:hypothetical protein
MFNITGRLAEIRKKIEQINNDLNDPDLSATAKICKCTIRKSLKIEAEQLEKLSSKQLNTNQC